MRLPLASIRAPAESIRPLGPGAARPGIPSTRQRPCTVSAAPSTTPRGPQLAGALQPGGERGVDRLRIQRGHRHRHRAVPEVAVFVEGAGRARRMPG